MVVALSETWPSAQPGDRRDARPDRLPVRAEAGRLAEQRRVEMVDDAAAAPAPARRVGEEAVGGGAAPLRIARREMHADIALREGAESASVSACRIDVAVRMGHDAALVRQA